MRFAKGLALATTFILIHFEPAVACRCTPPPPPLEELAQSSAVFSGTVVAIEVDPTPLISPVKKVTIAVEECWKGDVAGQVIVETNLHGAACGVGFELQERYLIYAGGTGSTLSTHLCTRTTLLELAQEDLDALGRPSCTTAVVPDTWGTIKRNYR